MFDDFDTIVTTLRSASIDARKTNHLLTDSGQLAIPNDASVLVTVRPLNSNRLVQWAKQKPVNERYQVLGMAKSESDARQVLDDCLTALPLPHYKPSSVNYINKLNNFFIYELILEVSPNA